MATQSCSHSMPGIACLIPLHISTSYLIGDHASQQQAPKKAARSEALQHTYPGSVTTQNVPAASSAHIKHLHRIRLACSAIMGT